MECHFVRVARASCPSAATSAGAVRRGAIGNDRRGLTQGIVGGVACLIRYWQRLLPGDDAPAPFNRSSMSSVRKASKAIMEQSVDSILAGKYPAKAHAAKVAAHLKSIDPDSASGTIYLQGQQTRLIEDNDEPQPFR